MIDVQTVKVTDVIGNPFGFASDDGEKVFAIAKAAIENKQQVVISFQGIEDLTTAFLNAAIGELYGLFSEQQINEYVVLVDLEPDDEFLVGRVVERVKQYFSDPVMSEYMDKVIARELEMDDE